MSTEFTSGQKLVGENRGEMFLVTQDAAHRVCSAEHSLCTCMRRKTFTSSLLINNFERRVLRIERTINTTAVHLR